MKSLNTLINESKGSVSVQYDNDPAWAILTPAINYGGQIVIIIGEPASRKNQEAWDYAYAAAQKLGSVRHIPKKIEDAFAELESEMGEDALDVKDCLCLCMERDGSYTIYTYKNGGVEPIK